MPNDETRQIVRLSFKEMFQMLGLSFVLFGITVWFFFYQAWHIPIEWQAIISVAIYIFMVILAMLWKWKVIAIKVKNQ